MRGSSRRRPDCGIVPGISRASGKASTGKPSGECHPCACPACQAGLRRCPCPRYAPPLASVHAYFTGLTAPPAETPLQFPPDFPPRSGSICQKMNRPGISGFVQKAKFSNNLFKISQLEITPSPDVIVKPRNQAFRPVAPHPLCVRISKPCPFPSRRSPGLCPQNLPVKRQLLPVLL